MLIAIRADEVRAGDKHGGLLVIAVEPDIWFTCFYFSASGARARLRNETEVLVEREVEMIAQRGEK